MESLTWEDQDSRAVDHLSGGLFGAHDMVMIDPCRCRR